MVYNIPLAARVRAQLGGKRGVKEKAMFGGLSFLLNGKMVVGVLKDDLVVRINPNESDTLIQKPLIRPMDFTGKPMKGFLYVNVKAVKTDIQLKTWINRGIDFVSSMKK